MCRANLSQLFAITSSFSSFYRFVCYLLIEMVTGELSVHADEKSWNLNCKGATVWYSIVQKK